MYFQLINIPLPALILCFTYSLSQQPLFALHHPQGLDCFPPTAHDPATALVLPGAGALRLSLGPPSAASPPHLPIESLVLWDKQRTCEAYFRLSVLNDQPVLPPLPPGILNGFKAYLLIPYTAASLAHPR